MEAKYIEEARKLAADIAALKQAAVEQKSRITRVWTEANRNNTALSEAAKLLNDAIAAQRIDDSVKGD